MPEIKVTIDRFGNPTIEALGFRGKDCLKATMGIEASLRGEKAKDTKRPEFYQGAGSGNVKVGS